MSHFLFLVWFLLAFHMSVWTADCAAKQWNTEHSWYICNICCENTSYQWPPVINTSAQQGNFSFFIQCLLFLRSLGRPSIRQWGGVLRRPMGLQNGQPFRRHAKKNCFFLPARGGFGHLRRHPETVQRATEDLPAGPCPPTHCHYHFSLP